MDPRFHRCVRAAAWARTGIACIAVACGACHAPPRVDVAVENSITAASGIDRPIVFLHVDANGGSAAAPDLAGDVLAMSEAVRRAVTTDPGLQAALARVRATQAEADQARLLPNPVLSFVVRGGSGSAQVEASLAQELVAVLQRPDRASAADNRLRAAASDAVANALDVALAVQESYVMAQASTALLPVLEERLALVARLAGTARARLDAGEGTRGEVVVLDAQRVDLEVSIDSARLEDRVNRLRLARQIGEPLSEGEWKLDEWSALDLDLGLGARGPGEPDEWDDSLWAHLALRARPEIRVMRWRLAALGDEAALAGLAAFDGAAAGIDAEHDDGWQIGPSLSTPLPLFDTGSARRDVIGAQVLEARHELVLVMRRVIEEVRTARESLAASRNNLARIRDVLIPLQHQRRQLAEDAYRAGQTDVTPLFLAEQDLRVAQTRAIEVGAQAAIARARLERAIGGAGVRVEIIECFPVGAPEDGDPSGSPVPDVDTSSPDGGEQPGNGGRA